MKTEKNAVITNYIAAYLAANPGKKTPEMCFERGWYHLTTFSDQGVRFPAKRRESQVLAMTERLTKRVQSN